MTHSNEAGTLYPLTLLYDGGCPVCSLEIDHLWERNSGARLAFVDIAAPGFDAAAWGTTQDAMNAEIHAAFPDGSLIKGVEVLRLAYGAVGLGWLLRPTGWAPLKPVFDTGYLVFARHRRAISRVAKPLITGIRELRARQTAQRMRRCATSTCAGGDEPGPTTRSTP